MIATHYAKRYPSRVAHLVLTGPASVQDDSDPARLADFLQGSLPRRLAFNAVVLAWRAGVTQLMAEMGEKGWGPEYFEALRGTEVCTGAVDDEYTNLLATPNEFATICDTQPSVCAAWEVAGYEANDPDAGDDASPGVTVEAVDPYSTKACRSCINSMQPSCAVEYCQMGLPDDDGEEEETVCGDSAAPRAASSGLLLRSLFLVAVVFAGGVVF